MMTIAIEEVPELQDGSFQLPPFSPDYNLVSSEVRHPIFPPTFTVASTYLKQRPAQTRLDPFNHDKSSSDSPPDLHAMASNKSAEIYDKDSDEDSEPNDEPFLASNTRGVIPGIPCPRSARESYLLLEAARAERQILLARERLAVQVIRRNTLTLQYNRLLLERVQNDLRAADQHIGRVRLTIRESGHSPAFEYAMQEDLLHMAVGTSRRPRPPSHFPIDVDLT